MHIPRTTISSQRAYGTSFWHLKALTPFARNYSTNCILLSLIFFSFGLMVYVSVSASSLWVAWSSHFHGLPASWSICPWTLGRCRFWSQPSEEAVAIQESSVPSDFQQLPFSCIIFRLLQPFLPSHLRGLHFMVTSLHPDTSGEGPYTRHVENKCIELIYSCNVIT